MAETTENLQYPRFRWFALFAMVIVTASTSSILIAPAPLIPTIFAAQNWDPGVTTAVTMLTFQICVCIFAFLGGFLIDKLGPVKIWIISLAIIILGCILVPLIGGTIHGLLVCRILHGMGTGPIMAQIIAFSAQRFPYEERTLVAAFQGFSVSTGIAIGLVFSPLMLRAAGGNWQTALMYDALIPIIAMIFAFIVFFGPQPPAREEKPNLNKTGGKSSDLTKALLGSTFWMLLIMMFLDSWCQQAWLNIASPFYASPVPMGLGLDPLDAGSKLAFGSYAMMAGTLLTPFITTKIFKGNFKALITAGLLISAAGMLYVRHLSADSGTWLVLVPIIVIFFSSFVNPNVVGFIARNYPDTITGRLGGFINAAGPGGAAIGVAIGSWLLSKYESFMPNMTVLTVLFVVAAMAIWFVKPPKGFEEHLNSIAEQEKENQEKIAN
ncbi:MFS transporter [Aminipila butyrica]|uniref:MFS transporter n=1 Tax=Aminipila butyrica TaxID=433296 RepID=A0A858BUU6_9FIRM|nr:MFS transporter [Aminipila butyrica]QIB68710.1 MFS transporter [Aminipila butyrica]